MLLSEREQGSFLKAAHFNLLCPRVHPEEQLADGVKGERLHVLKPPPDNDLLSRTSVQTQPLRRHPDRGTDDEDTIYVDICYSVCFSDKKYLQYLSVNSNRK